MRPFREREALSSGNLPGSVMLYLSRRPPPGNVKKNGPAHPVKGGRTRRPAAPSEAARTQ